MKDIYWLAGILEGEATFRFKGYGPAISLRMTDSDVVGRAAQIWKKPILGPYAPSGRFSKKPSWSTEVTCSEAAGWMMTLFPLLGIKNAFGKPIYLRKICLNLFKCHLLKRVYINK